MSSPVAIFGIIACSGVPAKPCAATMVSTLGDARSRLRNQRLDGLGFVHLRLGDAGCLQ